MNLKEAFRYQNKIQALMAEAQDILGKEKNITRVEKTTLQSKVVSGAEDIVVVEIPETEFEEQITDIVVLLMFLLNEKEKLSYAIRAAKKAMSIDFDGEVSLNAKRQEVAGLFRKMNEIRSSEVTISGGGTGFKFNAEGNQVSFRCDMKRVVSINFDRNKVRSYANGLSKKADEVSADLDKAMVNTEVAYEAPFDVNDTFAEVLQWHICKDK